MHYSESPCFAQQDQKSSGSLSGYQLVQFHVSFDESSMFWALLKKVEAQTQSLPPCYITMYQPPLTKYSGSALAGAGKLLNLDAQRLLLRLFCGQNAVFLQSLASSILKVFCVHTVRHSNHMRIVHNLVQVSAYMKLDTWNLLTSLLDSEMHQTATWRYRFSDGRFWLSV